MILSRLRVARAASALMIATPASATWLEAQTDHFIIDADTTEAKLRDFSTRLERYDSALRRLYDVGSSDAALGPNRVIIFAVGSSSLMRLCGKCSPGVRGFYRSGLDLPVIVTTALGSGAAEDLSPLTTLLHEYSHHFMFANAPGGYPQWYTEGFAEFNSNADFRPDGSIIIGLPARYRSYALSGDISSAKVDGLFSKQTSSFPIKDVIDAPRSLQLSVQDWDQFYGRSWLLMNYLQLTPSRRGQLADYISQVNHGRASIDAAKKAFGDLNELSKDLSRYLAAKQALAPLRVPPLSVQPQIAITPLSAGAAAMMPAYMQSRVGLTVTQAKTSLPGIMTQAASYPKDLRAQLELAEAALDARDAKTADAAADRALVAAPTNATALLFKGQATLNIAISDSGDPAKISAARAWIVKANRADPDFVLPLLAYYQSFLAAKQPPTTASIHGLMRAVVVAPESVPARWWLAAYLLDQKDDAAAREMLAGEEPRDDESVGK